MAGRTGMRDTRRDEAEKASYDEATSRRFGSGHGYFGFGDGGGDLPLVFAILMVFVILIVVKLGYVQLYMGEDLAKQAEEHRTNKIVLQARRGTIYDRNGNVLAVSEECYDVCVNPKQIDELKRVGAAIIVAKYLGGAAQDYLEIFKQDITFSYLAHQADKQVCEDMVEELRDGGYDGVYLVAQMRRAYPYGELAGQVLGMVDRDGKGLTGLELQYDPWLKGEDGELIMETGLYGVPIAGAASERTEPTDGMNLVLALDIDVQRSVEENVLKGMEESKATSGFALVMDPRNGEIIAACSTPYADLTHEEMVSNEMLNLKLVSDCYEPGSIAKVLTAAIGLESKTVDANDYFWVPYSIMVGDGIVFDVDDRNEWEQMNLREMLRRSSNVAAALISQENIGAENFAKGLESFGIGQLTGIDYPGEVPGLIKTLDEYDASSVGSMSFGQGFSVPMVQMCRAISAIADKGVMYTPHCAVSRGAKTLDWSKGEQAVSAEVAEQVADMMVTVVEDGTAAEGAVEGYEVAAKTGTGEIPDKGKYLKNKYLATLVGFAPAHDAQVLVCVGLRETPYLSYSTAGPVFSAIMGEALSDLGVLAQDKGV